MKFDIDQKGYLIDQVAALDLPARKVVRQLYEAALKKLNKSLCLAAAEKIATEAERGDSAFIVTGFPIPPPRICGRPMDPWVLWCWLRLFAWLG